MENSNQVQKVTVEKIYNNRTNPKSPFKTLQLRVERPKEAVNSNDVLSMFLGGIQNVEKLVGFQTMEQGQIDSFGIQEGDNLNEKLPQAIKLVVSEITASEFNALEDTAQIPYRAKRIPESANTNPGNYLVTNDGEYIYRGILVTAAKDEALTDSYISHVGNTETAPAETESASVDDVVGDDVAY